MAQKISEKLRTADVKLNYEENVTFSSLLLSASVLSGLEKAGFFRPSPIQFEAIPIGRCGFDMIVQAKSGTGKTCVFVVIALETINVNCKNIQALVLAPTREIGVQIAEVFHVIASCIPKFKCCAFIGGLPLKDDLQKLKGCHVAVGTPGRIKQLIQDGLLRTDAIRLFVLDEADKLLEEKFQKDINWIYHKLPVMKQMLALSATYPEALALLLTQYMQSPKFVRLNSDDIALLGIRQYYMITEFHPLQTKTYENKIPHLLNILTSVQFSQCLIFSNYQIRAEGLRDRLNTCGWPTEFISGKQVQKDRLQVMSQLKKFRCRILVSTDLTARGIDVENVNLIVNLDVPHDLETYLHRIGRAGRFGSLGLAITFAAAGTELETLKHMQLKGNLKLSKISDDMTKNLWEMEEQSSEFIPDSQFNTRSADSKEMNLITHGNAEDSHNTYERNESIQKSHNNFVETEKKIYISSATGQENIEKDEIQNGYLESVSKTTVNPEMKKVKKMKKVNQKCRNAKSESDDDADHEGMKIGAVMLEKLQLEHNKELSNKGNEVAEHCRRITDIIACDKKFNKLSELDFNIVSEEDSLLRFSEIVQQNGENCPVYCDQTSVSGQPAVQLLKELSASDREFLEEKHNEFLSLISDDVLIKGLFEKICPPKHSSLEKIVQFRPDNFSGKTNSTEISDSEFDDEGKEKNEVRVNRNDFHDENDKTLTPKYESLQDNLEDKQFCDHISLATYSVFQSEYIRLMLQTKRHSP